MATKNVHQGVITDAGNKTRCKPGDRAKVINAVNPQNIGLIVCVVRPYKSRETVEGSSWETNGTSWVVVSLSRSIAGILTMGQPLGKIDFCRTAVFDDANLVPLNDDDASVSITATKKKPQSKKREMSHAA
jgi:hypothetical protein